MSFTIMKTNHTIQTRGKLSNWNIYRKNRNRSQSLSPEGNRNYCSQNINKVTSDYLTWNPNAVNSDVQIRACTVSVNAYATTGWLVRGCNMAQVWGPIQSNDPMLTFEKIWQFLFLWKGLLAKTSNSQGI